jgi:hypothetical protein
MPTSRETARLARIADGTVSTPPDVSVSTITLRDQIALAMLPAVYAKATAAQLAAPDGLTNVVARTVEMAEAFLKYRATRRTPK